MPANLYLLVIDLALALVTAFLVRRDRASQRREVPTSKADNPDRIAALVRLGQIGGQALAGPIRSSVRVAPVDEAGIALEVLAGDGAQLACIAPDRVVMVRCWSGGRQVISIGAPRPAYGPFWPLGPNLAGWEIHLATASGETLRCYGAPGTSLDLELDRLQDRIRRFPIARAS
jgi:hypothetical protein